MNRLIPALALAALALAGCTNGASVASPPRATAPPSTSAPVATCASVASKIKPVIKDQASQDASEEENWVDIATGADTSQGNDLQNAANFVTGISKAYGQLAPDLSNFANDANAFFADESNGLLPGWTGPYGTLENAINALSKLCGYPK